MENMKIYNDARVVPSEAQKKIGGGRLKGMTDINPMWRIKKLTEIFGPVGLGWKYDIVEERLEVSPTTEEFAAFVKINLYYKWEGEWSEAIPGTGGSMFITKERQGMHVSDECFKMALTDAISVACKALGFGADIYWDKDKTKYTPKNPESGPAGDPIDAMVGSKVSKINKVQKKALYEASGKNLEIIREVKKQLGYTDQDEINLEDLGKANKLIKELVEKESA